MFSRCLEHKTAKCAAAPSARGVGFALVLLLVSGLAGCTAMSSVDEITSRPLRVCADPNNLPFSNERLEGFENKIAELVASDLNRPLEYTWWAQRRGFVRNTLNAGLCDVLIGVPAAFEAVLTTAPYYRSSYVFVSREDRALSITSFDDPLLRTLTIGVHLAGDDFASTPPAHTLAARNIVNNVRGYPIYADYSLPNPTARIIDAVAGGAIDIAVVWGPLAGYFSRHEKVPLHVDVVDTPSSPAAPFIFDISMGVRTNDVALRDQLERVLEKQRKQIDRILDEYGVPRISRNHVGTR